MIDRLVIIGVGLIGSSIALALKQASLVGQVIGCGRDRKNLEKALELGVIDSYQPDAAEAVRFADMIVLAVPLGAMQMLLAAIKDTIPAKAVITDVGSVKGSVVRDASAILGANIARFVPGHPVAGTEKSGVEAGFASLYQNRKVILTPLKSTAVDAIEKVDQMWRACGANVEYLDVEHHDRVLAATSHLPHMLAYTLVHLLSGMHEQDEIFKYVAGGFRDFTRIASSDPVMWRDICVANPKPLLRLIDAYKNELDLVATAIGDADGDRLIQLFNQAKVKRDSLTDI